MILKSLTVSGFKNVKSTCLDFTSKTLAVVSPNNYGKSNLLEALTFATDFISAGTKQRTMMMSWIDGIPIVKGLDSSPFQFDMEFELPNQEEYRFVHYGFTFLLYHVFPLLNTDKVIICGNLTAPKMKHFSVACKSVSRHYNRKQHSAYLAQGVQPARRCVRSEKREIYHVGHQDHSYYLPEGKAAGRV